MPTPNAKNIFELKDVESYSPDVRVRRALKSLATLGTSQTVAQAAMWHVCNGMSLDQLARQDVVAFNAHELAQAARFIEALDTSSSDLVDPAYFQNGRLVVRLGGEGLTAKDAKRLAGELDGVRMIGLPVKVVADLDNLEARPGTVLLTAAIVASKPGMTSTRVTVRAASANGEWQPLGQFDARSASAVSDLKAADLATDMARGHGEDIRLSHAGPPRPGRHHDEGHQPPANDDRESDAEDRQGGRRCPGCLGRHQPRPLGLGGDPGRHGGRGFGRVERPLSRLHARGEGCRGRCGGIQEIGHSSATSAASAHPGMSRISSRNIA